MPGYNLFTRVMWAPSIASIGNGKALNSFSQSTLHSQSIFISTLLNFHLVHMQRAISMSIVVYGRLITPETIGVPHDKLAVLCPKRHLYEFTQ